MKRIIAFFALILLSVNLVACSSNSASNTINTFCNAMKSFDAKTMGGCFGKDVDGFDMDSLDNEYLGYIISHIKSNANKITYNIVSEEDGNATNKKKVTVNFEYPDLSAAFSDAVASYFKEVLTMAFSGKSDGEMAEMFAKNFTESLSNNKNVNTNKKTTVFICEERDGKWIISDYDEGDILDIITGNVMSAVNNIANIFS